MKLVSFSVTNFRSITKASKLPFGQSTIFIGPNNEGKSNILSALVAALELLSSLGKIRILKGRLRSFMGMEIKEIYDWTRDFPISLQEKNPSGESIFQLEFELTPDEIVEFSTEVSSSLNGTLPIQLSLGQKEPGFRVLKKGRGAAVLTKKAELIAQFVAKRIDIKHIPAVRTAHSAHRVVDRIVEKSLSTIEQDQGYRNAIAEVAKLQKPILEKISSSIQETLKEFLPNVKGVQVLISEEQRFRALRRSCEIIVDDGTPTQLSRKGDGVQSLAALSLMRHSSMSGSTGKNLILAIEEPESHLHPLAIHQLRKVIAEINQKHQVIMTTHCPLFVDRANVRANILVHKNKAAPAKDVRQIREILGVRAADNLQNAEVILLVEGEDDKASLTALLVHFSSPVKVALSNGTLCIESLLGGYNLGYRISHVREAMCIVHCFMDHDRCGIEAVQRAEKDGLLIPADETFALCQGMRESEIEDMFDESLYAGLLQNKYGVSTLSPKFRGDRKWSERLRKTFNHQGKTWSDEIEKSVKRDISDLVKVNPSAALNAHKRAAFDALAQALELKLQKDK